MLYGMKETPISVRFEKGDLDAITEAARLEGLNPAAYCRRCVVLYTRDRHPNAYPPDAPKTE